MARPGRRHAPRQPVICYLGYTARMDVTMRLLVLLLALAMPVIAWLSQTGAFGPTNAEVSARYPTLLVPAGYAFSIWGLIFLLDVIHGALQLRRGHGAEPVHAAMAPWSALAFGATAAWMPLFSAGQYALCVLVILAATVGAVRAASTACSAGRRAGIARWALPLHAGWLTLASALNIAQVIVAYRLLPTADMPGWSLALLAVATFALLAVNTRLRSLPYAAAAIWGLAATYVQQSDGPLSGGSTAAVAALVAAALVLAHALWAVRRGT